VGSESRKGTKNYYVYNKEGQKLMEIEGRTYHNSGDYLLVANKTTTIIDTQGQIFEKGRSVKNTHHNFMLVGEDANFYVTPRANFFGTNDPALHFSNISKQLIDKKGKELVVASKDGKKGIIKKDGTMVLPFVFDEIITGYSSKKELVAKYEGTLGVLLVPGM